MKRLTLAFLLLATPCLAHDPQPGKTTKAELLQAVDALRLQVQNLPDDGPVVPPPPPHDDNQHPPADTYQTVQIPGEGWKIATHAGLIPDLSANPTHTLASGDFPIDLPVDARVLIPTGVTVTLHSVIDQRIESIANKGTLKFSRLSNTKLRVGTILNYPGSVYDQGDDEDPVEASSEILFDGTLPASDPEQITVGLISFGGKTTVCGKFIDGTSTTELAAPVAAGSKVITVKASKGWKVGDELLLHDDRDVIDPARLNTTMERATIAAIGSTGITLAKPLAYAHSGDVDHLTRNIVFRNAPGTRAHTILMGQTDAHLCCARFNLSGRTRSPVILDDTLRNPDNSVLHTGTNQRGRYPVHAHHLQLPFAFDHLVIDADQPDAKWGLSHHTGHGSVTNCVATGFYGAGIVGESGPETGLHAGNSVSRYMRESAEADYRRFGVLDAAGKLVDDRGFYGAGFWYRGPFVRIEDCKFNGWAVDGFAWDTEVDSAAPVQHPLTTLAPIDGRPPEQVGAFDLEISDSMPIKRCTVKQVMLGDGGGIVFWGRGGLNTIEGCRVRRQNYFGGVPFLSYHSCGPTTTRVLIKDSRAEISPVIGGRWVFNQTDGMLELAIENLTQTGYVGPVVEPRFLEGIGKATLDGKSLK